jgi:hypothetical protein
MDTSKDLTIQDILTIEDRKIARVYVEEWDGWIYIRVLSAKERSEIEDLFAKMSNSKMESGKFRKELLKRTWVDKSGDMVIADEAVATHMMNKSATAIEAIFEASCEINAFRKKDVDTLKKK